MQNITIRISKDGSCNFDLKGVKGKGCAELAKKLATALGAVEKMEATSEFYELTPVINTQQANT